MKRPRWKTVGDVQRWRPRPPATDGSDTAPLGMAVKRGLRFVSKHMRNVDGSELVMVVSALRYWRNRDGELVETTVYYRTEGATCAQWYAKLEYFLAESVGRIL